MVTCGYYNNEEEFIETKIRINNLYLSSYEERNYPLRCSLCNHKLTLLPLDSVLAEYWGNCSCIPPRTIAFDNIIAAFLEAEEIIEDKYNVAILFTKNTGIDIISRERIGSTRQERRFKDLTKSELIDIRTDFYYEMSKRLHVTYMQESDLFQYK